jgi:hypothetical protein
MKAPVPASFAWACEQFIADLERRFERLEAALPRTKRWKNRVRGLVSSKGERRRQHEHFASRFAVVYESVTPPQRAI